MGLIGVVMKEGFQIVSSIEIDTIESYFYVIAVLILIGLPLRERACPRTEDPTPHLFPRGILRVSNPKPMGPGGDDYTEGSVLAYPKGLGIHPCPYYNAPYPQTPLFHPQG